MIIEVSTEVSLPVILIDDSDFKTPLTGISSDVMTIRYSPPDSFDWKIKSTDEFNEIGDGLYLITFSSSQIGQFEGEFLYFARAETDDLSSLPFWGSVQLVKKSLNALDSIDSQIDILEFLLATLAGHGLHIVAKDPSSYLLFLQEAKKAITNLPLKYQAAATRSLSFFQLNFGPLRPKKPTKRKVY